jgi:MFS family permease
MGFQYQSVAAVAPLIMSDLGVGLADIGLLFGLYLAPGIVLAMPGGAIGRRFGDKPVVLAGLAMMVAGGALTAVFPAWPAQIAGRLLAGTGGVLLNVLMSKMVTDWFAGREIATAMAVFVNSWPAGIALALIVLPPIGAAEGVSVAHFVATALIACGLVLLAAFYAPLPATTQKLEGAGRPGQRVLAAVLVAGALWGFYNIGFAMVFAFGPAMLVERGWSVAAAGSAVSIVLWLAIVSVPLGGFMADRLRLYAPVIAAGCCASALLLLAASRDGSTVAIFAGLGLVSGLPAGAIMSLPTQVLGPAARAVGMGLFFTVFYTAMVVGPALGGLVASRAGTAGAAFDLGAAMLLACLPLVWLFRVLAHRLAPQLAS